jgi:hypothetical protein
VSIGGAIEPEAQHIIDAGIESGVRLNFLPKLLHRDTSLTPAVPPERRPERWPPHWYRVDSRYEQNWLAHDKCFSIPKLCESTELDHLDGCSSR